MERGRISKRGNPTSIIRSWFSSGSIMGLPHSFWCWEIPNDYARLRYPQIIPCSLRLHITVISTLSQILGDSRSFSLFRMFWHLSLPFRRNFQDVLFSIDMKSLCMFSRHLQYFTWQSFLRTKRFHCMSHHLSLQIPHSDAISDTMHDDTNDTACLSV